MKKLLIWGASGHARVVADIVRTRAEYDIVAFIDDTSIAAAEIVGGLPVLRDRSAVLRLRNEGAAEIVIGVGDCARRLDIAKWCQEQRFNLATMIHPAAVVSPSCAIGTGTVVMAGAVINADAIIGANVIINTSATVDHDCVVADGCHISPGAHLGGNVCVGRATWIGIGATVRHGIRIGSGSVVGAGAVVVTDLPDAVVAYGVPARVARKGGA